MGNCNDLQHSRKKDNQKNERKLSFSKFKKNKKNTKPDDSFIVEYVQNNKYIGSSINIESLDQRRVVFVSLIGLYHSWRRVPPFVLYPSLLIMPLKKEWIYKLPKLENELNPELVMKLGAYDVNEANEFISLLKWKDSQGLVVWMLDNYDQYQSENKLIQPFWNFLSEKLSSLYDPITGSTYNTLNLNGNWWKNKQFAPKYNTNVVSITSELYFLNMKYDSVQEILYQSNPKSLIPMKSYTPNKYESINVSKIKEEQTNYFFFKEYEQYSVTNDDNNVQYNIPWEDILSL